MSLSFKETKVTRREFVFEYFTKEQTTFILELSAANSSSWTLYPKDNNKGKDSPSFSIRDLCIICQEVRKNCPDDFTLKYKGQSISFYKSTNIQDEILGYLKV